MQLETQQRDLLGRICSGPLLDEEELRAAGAFAGPKNTKGGRTDAVHGDQLSLTL